MWKPTEDRGDGPPPVPSCSFCGKETSCLHPRNVRGVTRYFCNEMHADLYEDLGQKALARRRVLHNADPVGDALLEMWLVCVKTLRVESGA